MTGLKGEPGNPGNSIRTAPAVTLRRATAARCVAIFVSCGPRLVVRPTGWLGSRFRHRPWAPAWLAVATSTQLLRTIQREPRTPEPRTAAVLSERQQRAQQVHAQ